MATKHGRGLVCTGPCTSSIQSNRPATAVCERARCSDETISCCVRGRCWRPGIAAAGAGRASRPLRGVSLWLTDVARARREGMTDADIPTLFDDHGLEAAELDCLTYWLPGTARPPTAVRRRRRDARDRQDFFTIAESIGGRSVDAAEIWGTPHGARRRGRSVRGVCDRAAEHGLLVHLEFLPWSAFPNVHSAWDVVRLADRPNGGVIVDSWHCAAQRDHPRRSRGDTGES